MLAALLPLVLPFAHAAAPLPVLDGAPLKTGAANGNDAAVVIGVEDYLRVADVPGATADAKLVRDFLVYTRGVQPDRVRLLTAGASREVILGALQDMAHRVGSGGTLWFYFAGHGGASPAGERLLFGDDVPTAPEAMAARSVTVAEIKKLGTAQGAQLMLVVDACFNGGTRQGGSVLEVGTRFVVPSAAITQVRGIAEWNAAGPSELARPLPGTGHGAFTYFWVGAGRGWADGQLDGKKDGSVTVEEAQEYIVESLSAVGITQQNPHVVVDSAKGWTLVKGAKETGPDLRVEVLVPEPAAPLPTVGTATYSAGGTDFAALAAEAARADAAARAATERAESVRKTLEDERSKRLDVARGAMLDKAERDWAAVRGVLKSGGSATRKVVETYVATYGEATVALDDTVIVVPIPQVAEATAWIEEQDRAAFASSRTTTAATGSLVYGAIPAGTRVRIDDISSEDAYYSSREGMIGLYCTPDADTNHNGEGWHGGPASCENGESYYFYKAALVPSGAGAPSAPKKAPAPTSASPHLEYDVPAGTAVRITGISAEDAYYPGSELLGLNCTAGEGMSHNGGGYHGGPMTCDNGESYYFYKAELALTAAGAASPAVPAGAQDLGDKVAEGRSVVIVDVSPEDAYYDNRFDLVGATCTVSGDLHRNDGLWYGGGADCPDGSKYFYKVQVATAAGGRPAAASSSSTGRLTGSVAAGTRVTLADLSSEDAYYEDRSSIVGKSCTTSDATSDNGGGWHGGPINCDDGSSYYFYKVALSGAGGGGSLGKPGQDVGDKVKDGTKLRITDLGSGDLYYPQRADYIGKSCTVSGDLHRNDGLFYGGGMTCEGQYWYFAYVSVERR